MIGCRRKNIKVTLVLPRACKGKKVRIGLKSSNLSSMLFMRLTGGEPTAFAMWQRRAVVVSLLTGGTKF